MDFNTICKEYEEREKELLALPDGWDGKRSLSYRPRVFQHTYRFLFELFRAVNTETFTMPLPGIFPYLHGNVTLEVDVEIGGRTIEMMFEIPQDQREKVDAYITVEENGVGIAEYVNELPLTALPEEFVAWLQKFLYQSDECVNGVVKH